jgi:hypothetical protein
MGPQDVNNEGKEKRMKRDNLTAPLSFLLFPGDPPVHTCCQSLVLPALHNPVTEFAHKPQKPTFPTEVRQSYPHAPLFLLFPQCYYPRIVAMAKGVAASHPTGTTYGRTVPEGVGGPFPDRLDENGRSSMVGTPPYRWRSWPCPALLARGRGTTTGTAVFGG